MATLQKIRTRGGLLVAIIIGLALFAFILGDLLQSGSSLFRKGQMEVGVIDGESVQYPDFQKKVEELGEIYRSNTGRTQLDEESWVQVREQTWQNIVRDKVMGEIYENVGLAVSSNELFDMLQGDNPHPIIQQIFTNQETGQFDRAGVVNFLKNLETGVTPEQKNYWLYLEKQIVSEGLISKYNNLVSKGLYVTREEAQQSLEARNKQINVELVGLRNIVIPDSTVKVTESEMKAYYEAHKNDYKSENTRTIEYITFNVVPSANDFKNAEKWINDIKADFQNAPDNVQFVTSNSDVSFNDTWYKEAGIPAALSTWVAGGAVVNDVYGPYMEGESYKLAKLHAVEMLPDSVQARHILLNVNSAEEVAGVQALADSLKKAIEAGSDFGTLARLYSKDQGSAVSGGDLGWFGRGMMVKPFENAAFNNKVNEVTIVPTQFGIHIVQTTKLGVLNKQMQFAILERTVTPSTQTEQATYGLASKFASENQSQKEFDAAVTNEKLIKKMAVLRENDRELAGLENPRILIRAAFSGETGSVLKNSDGSPIFEMGNTFVIATLTGATEEGTASFASVKDRVELAVQNEKKSKLLADRIKNAAAGKNDMYAIASALGTQVTIASAINFNTVSIPDFGMEPAVVGTAYSIQPNVVSSPIEGNNGVYVLKVTSVEDLGDTNVDTEKQRLAQGLGYRASMQTLDVSQKAVKIVDKRAKFY